MTTTLHPSRAAHGAHGEGKDPTAPFDSALAADDRSCCADPLGRPLSLRKNFLFNLSGNGIFMVARWAMIVVLAKLGNAEMIGVLTLAMAVNAPGTAMANLALRSAMATDAKRQFRFNDYLGLRLAAALLALLAVCGTVAVAGYQGRIALVILVVGLGKFFELASDVFYGLFQQRERMDCIAVSHFFREPLIVGLLALGVFWTGDLVWGILGFPLAVAATFFLYDLPKGRRLLRATSAEAPAAPDTLRPCWHAPTLLRLAWTTLPLGLVMMLISLVVSLPRYAVSHYLGEHMLGVFGAIASLTTASVFVVAALGNSASPRMAKYFAAGNLAGFGRLLVWQLAVVACMGTAAVLGLALVGRPILRLLYDAEIARHAPLAVWLMIAAVLWNLNGPLGRALDATRSFSLHFAVRLAGVLVLAALLPGFVASWGMEGAALAMIAGAFVSMAAYLAALLYCLRQARPSGP